MAQRPQISQPRVYFSTEFDVIAMDDEECEPSVIREWDEWEDKVSAQDDRTMEDKANAHEKSFSRGLPAKDNSTMPTRSKEPDAALARLSRLIQTCQTVKSTIYLGSS